MSRAKKTMHTGLAAPNKKLHTMLLYFVVLLFFQIWITLLLPESGNMISVSGDARDIWLTIVSWNTNDVHGSYVLYKGIFSLFPYVWLYQLSILTHTAPFFYIQIYHAVLFSYVTVYALPNIIQRLTGHTVRLWQRTLLVLVCFFAWYPTSALHQLIIDLPSCAVFILASNGVMRTFPQKTWQRVLYSLYTGLLLGMTFCFSGQYTPAAILLLIYAVHRVFRALKKHKTVLKNSVVILCILLVLLGMSSIYMSNTLFLSEVVDEMREEGAFIPTGTTWMQRAFMVLNSNYSLFSNPPMKNYRFISMQEERFGISDPNELYELAIASDTIWDVKDYLHFMLTRPVDAFTQYFSRLFISLSPSNNNQSAVFLWGAYTLLFTALYGAFQRIKQLKDLFNKRLWITLAFLSTMIAPMVMTLEMRFALSIQGFVFAAAICSNTLKKPLQQLCQALKDVWTKKSLHNLGEKGFPKGFVLYLLFLCLCFGYIAVLYETAYPADILFHWF